MLFNNISLMTPPKQAVTVPSITQITGCNPSVIPVYSPTIVKKPNPIESNNNNILWKFCKTLVNNNAAIVLITTINPELISNIHLTGISPINKSRRVPAPIAVTKAMIKFRIGLLFHSSKCSCYTKSYSSGNIND